MIKHFFLTIAVMSTLIGGTTLRANSFLNMDPHEVRNLINSKCMSIDAEIPEVGSIEERIVEAAGRRTPLRIYTPSEGDQFPLILFIHGGAWVAGNLDTHDNLARYLCKKVGAVVLSVDYQNAPEGKFPFQIEQCYDALLWAKSNTKQIRIDDRVAVVGDSAGANMAAALCLMSRDREGPRIDFQVLINPAPDLSCEGTVEPQDNQLDFLRWQVKMYLENPEDIYHPYVSPSLAKDLTYLPTALILLAEHDDLCPRWTTLCRQIA